MGWLHALHVRSALARQRWWQAVHMLDGMRDHVVALACLRHGLPPSDGRGTDRLPAASTERLAAARAGEVCPAELGRSFSEMTRMFLDEVVQADSDLAARLRGPAEELAAR